MFNYEITININIDISQLQIYIYNSLFLFVSEIETSFKRKYASGELIVSYLNSFTCAGFYSTGSNLYFLAIVLFYTLSEAAY